MAMRQPADARAEPRLGLAIVPAIATLTARVA